MLQRTTYWNLQHYRLIEKICGRFLNSTTTYLQSRSSVAWEHLSSCKNHQNSPSYRVPFQALVRRTISKAISYEFQDWHVLVKSRSHTCFQTLFLLVVLKLAGDLLLYTDLGYSLSDLVAKGSYFVSSWGESYVAEKF